jgi:hypothetical protein
MESGRESSTIVQTRIEIHEWRADGVPLIDEFPVGNQGSVPVAIPSTAPNARIHFCHARTHNFLMPRPNHRRSGCILLFASFPRYEA